MTDILEFLDGAGQHASGGQGGIDQRRCIRSHSCRDPDIEVVDGSGFCRACLAYLAGHTSKDPLGDRLSPPVPPLPPLPPDGADTTTWQEYMTAVSRSYS